MNFLYFSNMIKNIVSWKEKKNQKEEIQIKVKLQQVHLKILCDDKWNLHISI